MIRTLELRRMDETLDSTISSLWSIDATDDSQRDTWLGFVVEDGMRLIKEPGKTRIPAGTYKLKKRSYGKFYDRYHAMYGHACVYELEGVPGYGDILIHIGNEVSDTRGCLLVNGTATFNPTTGTYAGQQSAIAYKRLYDYIRSIWGTEGVQIRIIR